MRPEEDDPAARQSAADDVEQLLARLREREPRFDVVQPVLRRITERPPRAAFRRVGITLAVVLGIGLLGALVVAPGALSAAGSWFRGIVVREAPPPGQSGAPRAVITTPGPGGGPIRHVGLAEARQLVSFPVALPQSVPSGFTLADITVFQPDPGMPPSQVFVMYHRPGANQPLALTYQAAGGSTLTAPPGATREMMVGGYHAVYIDQAAEGARPADGGPPLQLGRLVVERPDLVLIASGDRRDGLDATTLAAVLASVP
ncbi:MAG: hypothetical protein ACR2M3_13300 [Thermomicrobiales bacterium]